MTMIDVDTVGLKECSDSVILASNGFNSEINNLYSRLYNVPKITKEWIGIGANNYASLVLKEKAQYVAYGNSLKEMGRILRGYAEELESIVEKTRI